MDYYQIWVDLKDSHRDVEFCGNVDKYLGHLRQKGMLEAWTISRRKLGFGPQELGDFNVTIAVRDLTQLEQMFQYVASRAGPIEQLHRAVYGMVTNFKAALYRTFPDPVRQPSKPARVAPFS